VIGTSAILIVDDNPSIARTLMDILDIKGYNVYSASSGVEALQIIEFKDVDILLTDVRMPEMDGVTLYKYARKTHPDMMTILMTAYAEDDIIQQGMKEGIKNVLTKPLDIDFLLGLINP
jgi:DNA-binding NtrC family response regulator